jgi:hypothetical protein
VGLHATWHNALAEAVMDHVMLNDLCHLVHACLAGFGHIL